jgi:transcription factor TFIIIB component B''
MFYKRLMIDNTYLRKSAGYDPDRPWDKEEALFAEARRDMNRLKAEDRGEIVDENGDIIGVGEPDDGLGDDHIGDETMDFDADVQEEEDVQEGEEGDEEVEGEVAEEVEGGQEEAPAEEVDAGQEALFLPGGDDDDAGSTA